MAASTAERVREAAEVLGIQDRASHNEIRSRYHEQIKEWHPDVPQKDPAVSYEMTLRLKEAYDLLVDYCVNYPHLSEGACNRGLETAGLQFNPREG